MTFALRILFQLYFQFYFSLHLLGFLARNLVARRTTHERRRSSNSFVSAGRLPSKRFTLAIVCMRGEEGGASEWCECGVWCGGARGMNEEVRRAPTCRHVCRTHRAHVARSLCKVSHDIG